MVFVVSATFYFSIATLSQNADNVFKNLKTSVVYVAYVLCEFQDWTQWLEKLIERENCIFICLK